MSSSIRSLRRWPRGPSSSRFGGREERGDRPELEHLLEGWDLTGELGNFPRDKGYHSRRNATLIQVRGGIPVRAITAHAMAKALCHPAGKRMVQRKRADGRAPRLRSIRRMVPEGVYGAFKGRFGNRVRARKRHHQRVEILCRPSVVGPVGLEPTTRWL